MCGTWSRPGSGRFPPHLLEFAAFLAERRDSQRLFVIDFDGDTPTMAPHLPITAWHSGGVGPLPTDSELASSVVCATLHEDPDTNLWAALRRSAAIAPTLVLCGDEAVIRDRASAGTSVQWFSEILEANGLRPGFVGRAAADEDGLPRATLAVVDSAAEKPIRAAPKGFRITAIIPAFNEIDIIGSTIERLVGQAIEVVVIDNWSTDGTFELLVDRYREPGPVRVERFPVGSGSLTFDLRAILGRVEEVARQSGADWVIRSDADELHESPWPEVGLRDALYGVQTKGFDCIDHTVVEFRPTSGAGVPGGDLIDRLRYCEFGRQRGHFFQVTAWRNRGQTVDLASSGGHNAVFDGQCVFPYKFLLRHYPLRSQGQAERKVFDERQPRWNREERAMGWHQHYDGLRPGHRFVWDAATLIRYDDDFARTYLIERLSGVGLPRESR